MKDARGVFRWLAIGCLVPLLSALVLQAFYTVTSQRQTMTQALHDKARSLSTMMVNITGPSLALDDADEVRVGLTYVKGDADLAFAAVVAPQGETISTFGDEKVATRALGAGAANWGKLSDDSDGTWEDLIIATSPVHVRSKPLGTVVIGLSTRNVEAAVQAMLLPAVAITLAGIVVAVVVVFWLSGALFRRNRDLKILMDNAEQGFLRVDFRGCLLPEHSAILERWFGPWRNGQPVWEYLGSACPRSAEWLQLMWENIESGVLPIEVALEQLPRTLTASALGAAATQFEVDYKPLRTARNTYHVMLVISDVTAKREQEEAKAQQREQLAIFTAVLRDRPGVEAFFREARRLVQSVTVEAPDAVTLKRDIHTLKGNAAIFGMARLSHSCHSIEEGLAEDQLALNATDREQLQRTWRDAELTLENLSSEEMREQLTLDMKEQRHILDLIEQRAAYETLACTVKSWSLRSARQILNGFAHQARQVAHRLGKGDVSTHVDADDLRVPANALDEFWTAFAHTVTNTIDHGYPEPERARARVLNVIFRAKRVDAQFVVELEDDGRGIDSSKLEARAKAAGHPYVGKDALLQTIFEDGVSTKDSVSETSGRGVGLSAVRAACVKTGGRCEVFSEPMRGTRFVFRWPASILSGGEDSP